MANIPVHNDIGKTSGCDKIQISWLNLMMGWLVTTMLDAKSWVKYCEELVDFKIDGRSNNCSIISTYADWLIKLILEI